jgi:quercetin dioxygenase-like cupin family protein
MHALPENLQITDAPVERIEEVCGIYFRSVLLEKAGVVIPQHVHDHDHATFVGSGRARVWIDGVWSGDYGAGWAVPIKAGCYHVFQSIEPMTRLTCVHDIESAESVKKKGL